MNNLIEMRKKSLKPKAQCVKVKRDGIQCANWSMGGSDYCRKHISGLIPVKYGAPIPEQTSRFGLYARKLNQAQKAIYAEICKSNMIDEFKKPDLEEELIAARIIMADVMQDEHLPNTAKIRAMETLSKITKIAKDIKAIDEQQLKKDFLEAVQDAMLFAFQRANQLADPAERARVFVDEFRNFFPKSIEQHAEVQVTP